MTALQDFIIEMWERLDCESVGERELSAIQAALSERFGESSIESPAAIARLLADEGAVLRHPEVLQFDAQWRASELVEPPLPKIDLRDLPAAKEWALLVEQRRLDLVGLADRALLERLTASVRRLRLELLLIAERRETYPEKDRLEAREVAGWLRVWLSAPDLFVDWLDLRLNSEEYLALARKLATE